MAAKSEAKREAKERGENWLWQLLAHKKKLPPLEIKLPKNFPVYNLPGMSGDTEVYVTNKIPPKYIVKQAQAPLKPTKLDLSQLGKPLDPKTLQLPNTPVDTGASWDPGKSWKPPHNN